MKKIIISLLMTGAVVSFNIDASAEGDVTKAENQAMENTDKMLVEGESTVSKEEIETFISKIEDLAKSYADNNDLFASVIIAQAIMESDGGTNRLSQEPNNNLFGIKGSFEGDTVECIAYEYDENKVLKRVQTNFRKYENIEESFDDYVSLLVNGVDENTQIYKGVWKSNAKTYENATKALEGVYATEANYAKKLDKLIETYHLEKYDNNTFEGVNEDLNLDTAFPEYDGVDYDTNNSYAWGNCTRYVYNRIKQLGGYIDLDMGNGQDWGRSGILKGYEVTNIPKQGTAVSFPAGVLNADGQYGHVAFVESVFPDGSINISEMNVQGFNMVSERVIPKEFTGLLNYVTPK